jgi:diaminopimelate epimerase
MRFFNFSKMNGAGNDFILFDFISDDKMKLTSDEIVSLCDRKKGIGADGVLLLFRSEEACFFVDFYNSDGKPGSLCGNGARCVIRYAYEKGLYNSNPLIFKFGDTVYKGEIEESGLPKFFLNPPAKLKTGFQIKVADSFITSHFCDTGSPHVIIELCEAPINAPIPFEKYKELSDLPVSLLGKEIRYHKDFAPSGVNVNFIKVIDEHNLEIRTYERGVENETDACGTGSSAAAVVSFALGKCKPPVRLLTKSGDYLTVDFNIIDNKLENLSLTGPAEINFNGSVQLIYK